MKTLFYLYLILPTIALAGNGEDCNLNKNGCNGSINSSVSQNLNGGTSSVPGLSEVSSAVTNSNTNTNTDGSGFIQAYYEPYNVNNTGSLYEQVNSNNDGSINNNNWIDDSPPNQ